jgi:hypothetical protein
VLKPTRRGRPTHHAVHGPRRAVDGVGHAHGWGTATHMGGVQRRTWVGTEAGTLTTPYMAHAAPLTVLATHMGGYSDAAERVRITSANVLSGVA